MFFYIETDLAQLIEYKQVKNLSLYIKERKGNVTDYHY